MSLLNLQTATVPEVRISFSASVVSRASSADVAHDLDGELAVRHPPEGGPERAALPLERVDEVRDEHLVLARRVGHDEVLALEAGVPLRHVAGRPREGEVAHRIARGGGLHERDGLVVALLVEAEHARGELRARVVRGLGEERLDEGAGPVHVLVGEEPERAQGRAVLAPRRGGRGGRAGGAEEGEEDGEAEGHFTSSS